MKFNNLILTASALASVSFAQVTSDVVGYISLGADTGDAVPANTEITVSIPFVKALEATLSVASSDGTNITVSESITAGAWNIPASGAPFMVEIATGTDEGIFAEISSNTNNTITLSGFGTGFVNSLQAGDTINIRETWTIQDVFGQKPANTIVSTFDSSGVTASAATQYVTDGNNNWFNLNGFTQSNDVVLYPGESFIYLNTTSTPVTDFLISGTLPSTSSRLVAKKDSVAPQESRVGYISPIDETLADTGLALVAGANGIISLYDNNATGINKSASAQYVTDGTNWFNLNGFAPSNDVTIQAGQGFLILRQDSGATDSVLVTEQSYQGNL